MNNYNNMDYYNYLNNNYNQPLYNQDAGFSNLYDPYQGFIRGNLFPQLYNSYKINNPYDVTPMNEQAQMLTNIDALTFAMIDLGLYLDIYPNDRNAIDLYNRYRVQNANYTNQYESKYGPLSLNSNALTADPWFWNDSPWPWESR